MLGFILLILKENIFIILNKILFLNLKIFISNLLLILLEIINLLTTYRNFILSLL